MTKAITADFADIITKIQILFGVFIADALTQWKREVWDKDLDDAFCCYPTMDSPCGCYGASVRDEYTRIKDE